MYFTVPVLFCVLSIAIGQVAANAACQMPFQGHPTRPDLCYTLLPKRKCDWIPGSIFIRGNCFVPSGHDVVPSRKFFCDFNEYFQHCKNVPGYCCMQSTKFECDKYTVVEYNATLGTCFAPVGQISIRTADNVKCPKPFEYDESCRQCVADVNITDHKISKEKCEAVGGHINGTQCNTDPIPEEPKRNCTDITDPDCLPPSFPTTTLTTTTTVETTPTKTTDEPERTTVTDFTTPKPTEHTTTSEPTGATKNNSSSGGLTTMTPQPLTSSTDKTTYDPTKTTDFNNVTTTTVAPTSAETTRVTRTTATPLPSSVGTDETTYNPTKTTDSRNFTTTTITPPTTESTDVTNSKTVITTTPGHATTLNSTSVGTTTTSTPPSTGITPSTSPQPPTSSSPTTPDSTKSTTPLPNDPTFNNTVAQGFNVSHNCPIGFMIMSHFCIGVWTPDCETKHNGYKYEEACFIRFNDSGSNVGKREIACDNLGATVKSNGANVTELSTSTALETTTTATTTTTTTTTIKPPPSPPQCRNIWTSCWKQRELCGDPTWFLRMINNCAVTCGYCHCQKNLINCRINHQYDRPPPPLPPRPAPYCRDIGSNCEKRLCNISKGYHDLYFINCKRTCGYC